MYKSINMYYFTTIFIVTIRKITLNLKINYKEH